MGFLYNLKYLILCMEKQFSAKGSTDFIGLPTGVPATERMKKPSSRGQWCLESLRAVRVGLQGRLLAAGSVSLVHMCGG